MELEKIGWSSFFNDQFEQCKMVESQPARVVSKHGQYYNLYDGLNQYQAELSGKFKFDASCKKDFPQVGDFVMIRVILNTNQAIIYKLLDRKTAFVRKAPISGGRKIRNERITGGKTEEQVIASNVDTVFIVSALDYNFNIARLERYLILVHNSGANPIIILNKADLCQDVNQYIKLIEEVTEKVPIHIISVKTDYNLDVFSQYLKIGQTVVFLGSSGVGKSSITNFLMNAHVQKTQEISQITGKGRHTTSHVEMWFHKSGGVIIDTPGLRELQLWCDEDAIDMSFEDIITLGNRCKYNNCTHQTEPYCAIREAIEQGQLDMKRYQRYLKLSEELDELKDRQIQYDKIKQKDKKIEKYGGNKCI